MPISTVCNIDSDLRSSSHARLIVAWCFTALCQLRQVRRYISAYCFRLFIVALARSRLDYGNFVPVGSLAYRLRLLQSVLNAAARQTFRLRQFDHITDSLAVPSL
jgi:hypothetical protein